MSARIQRRMDAEFPRLTRSLIDAVYPHYGRPTPSAGVFQFTPATDEGSLVEGYKVPKGTRLLARTASHQQTGCRFDTTCDVTLWPLRISQACLFSRDTTPPVTVSSEFHHPSIRSSLWITFETTAAVSISQIQMDSLQLHLRGGEIGYQLLELLMAHADTIAISGDAQSGKPNEESWQSFETSRFLQLGLGPDESLLPGDSRSFSGHRLLEEYFTLPEKFLFVKLDGLRQLLSSIEGRRFHLLVGFDQTPASLIDRVSYDHFALHCVPAVNLFKKRADRIHVDHAQHEHQLVCDRSRPLDFEVWSIEEMAGHTTATAREIPCLPMYAPPVMQNTPVPTQSLYFNIDRRMRLLAESTKHPNRTSYLGSEVFVGFTDAQSHSMRSSMDRLSIDQISSTVYCTNRDLPLLAPEGGWRGAFSVEASGPIAQVACLVGPTLPRNSLAQADGEACWRLISHLTPNYLSLTDSEYGGATMIRELLHLYCDSNDQPSLKQIEGIRSIRHHPVVRRIPSQGPLTYARGVEIELVCDETAFGRGRAFLLGAILERFFAKFVSINSFAETHLVSTHRGSIYRWPVQIGSNAMI